MKQESAQEAREAPGDSGSGRLSFVVQVTAITVLIASCLIGHAWWRTGSMGLVWPYLAGQRLLIEPSELNLGDVGKGTIAERTMRVVNASSHELTLLGSQASCGCIAFGAFPVVIPAAKEHHLQLKISIPLEAGPFEQNFKLFCDDRGYSSVVVEVAGEVQ